MTEVAETHAEPPRRKIRKWAFIVIGVILCVWGYVYLSEKILSVEETRLSDWYLPANAERHFARKFVTADEIESYLSNATILFSHPSAGNSVFYFGASHRFVLWTGPRLDLTEGIWWTNWYLFPMTFNGRWRIAPVQEFCIHYYGTLFDTRQREQCRFVEYLGGLFPYSHALPEYRAGNVFDLRKAAPFRLPDDKEISIDGLLAMKKAQGGQ
ncbi:hypothetical protein [Bradyrhizobium sp. NP1]|uniref:hypothetical protein n=1 Tax=Bradyrhizobium sp. NP1 TaxID=3049772 RepID=UPI0025A53023|nr:hypothetical protein [Bradyrhizobium sp. NP1]WJR76502.1 hypothetical protein QOU61_27615 [Bradyrhizobium sp. NP1]